MTPEEKEIVAKIKSAVLCVDLLGYTSCKHSEENELKYAAEWCDDLLERPDEQRE